MTDTSSSEHLRITAAEAHALFGHASLGIGRAAFGDARWTDVNDAFCRMLGRTRTEMLATPWTAMTHPDDIDDDLSQFREMASGMLDYYTVEKRFLHYDGHAVWAKLTLSLVRDSAGRPDYEFALIEDISERKATEQALALSRQELDAERLRWQTIVDTIPTGLIVFNEAGELVLENAEWQRTWAKCGPVSPTMDYDSYRGYHPDTGARVTTEEWPCAESFMHGKIVRGAVFDIKRFDDAPGTIMVSSAPILDADGRVVGAVGANMDISALREAQARLLEADGRKDDFLAMLAHELRNPLAPIRNSLFILDRVDPASAQARQAKDVIGRQVTHLVELVDDLLDVTRIARGKVELQRSPLDLAAVVTGAADDYRDLIKARGLALEVELPAPGPALMVDGDATRLAQVLGNLLANAIKFTPQGGRIALSVQQEAGQAAIRVRDTGPGIAAELLPIIFEPFTQATQALARTEGGLGLGLALVKGMVELHGGNVAVASTPGAGATFTVTLPLLPAVPATAAPDALDAGGARPYRVLVVDDNVDAADSLASLVGMFGHTVEVAYDGISAVALGQASRHDLVLCDIGLPGMNGYEVARALRLSVPAATRLVAVSGYAQPDDVSKALAAGFDAHFAKPLALPHIEQLLAVNC